MAYVYFGRGGSADNGNWTDQNQWWSGLGGFVGETYYGPSGLGRVGLESDTIDFRQAITSNFPTSWTGTTESLKLGLPGTPATGTWSGPMSGSITIYGTSTAPVISRQLPQGGYHYFYGGVVTGPLNSSGSLTFAGDSRCTTSTAITGLYSLTINDTAQVTANVSLSTGYLYIYGGVLNGTVSAYYMVMSGGTILNSPTISVTGPTGGPSGYYFKYSGGTLPNTTLITAPNLTLQGVTIPVTMALSCKYYLLIDNSTVIGSFSFNGNEATRNLTITHNSIIAQDISTAAINCYRYYIWSGTFPHPNDCVFGSLSKGTDQINIGVHFDVNYYGTFISKESLVTSKNITVYTNSGGSNLQFNVPNFAYFPANTQPSPTSYGTFTGIIRLLGTTANPTPPSVRVEGGTYAPTVPVSASTSGTNYVLNYSDLPIDPGFGSGVGGQGIFSPTVVVQGFYGGDILGTLV